MQPHDPAPCLSWKPGPPPLDRPGRWLFETEGFLSGDITSYVVTITDDLEVACACGGYSYGNSGRTAFIHTHAVRHFGPIPSPPSS